MKRQKQTQSKYFEKFLHNVFVDCNLLTIVDKNTNVCIFSDRFDNIVYHENVRAAAYTTSAVGENSSAKKHQSKSRLFHNY